MKMIATLVTWPPLIHIGTFFWISSESVVIENLLDAYGLGNNIARAAGSYKC